MRNTENTYSDPQCKLRNPGLGMTIIANSGETKIMHNWLSRQSTDFDAKLLDSAHFLNSRAVTIVTASEQQSHLRTVLQKAVELMQVMGSKSRGERKMKKSAVSNILGVTVVVMLSVSSAFAQGTPKLDLKIEDQKINLSQTEKRDAKSITYLPGDTLRYILTASNIGDGLMTDPEIVDPIPAGVTYIPETAVGADTDITFSINQGSAYMPWPPYYTVRNSKGILIKRNATPDMISHIKWKILKNLEPGDSRQLEFAVEVNK